MKKQFLRVKQLADQTFARAEKSEVLSEDLTTAERKVESIRQTCECLKKRIQGCLQGQGTDGPSVEKRMKKVPESVLGHSMLESGGTLGSTSVLGKVLLHCGRLEAGIGKEVVSHEIQLEGYVLGPLQAFLEAEFPELTKLRRQLSKLTLDMDAARTRYQTAARSTVGASVNKADAMKEELEEAQTKVTQCRDNLAGEMFQLLSREEELSGLLLHMVQLQRDYHQAIFKLLDSEVASLEMVISNNPAKPVYGVSLEEHLRVTERQIAYPIELAVCSLLELGMKEEGLLRVAPGASKVKKLKGAFDVNLVDLPMLLEFRDPHVIAGALKSYLRELPVPLMVSELYPDWIAAARIQDEDARLQALWQVVHSLPESHMANLRYLIRFLALLAKHQDHNKMGEHNIAIVLAHSLLWMAREEKDGHAGMDPASSGLLTSIVFSLVKYADWFFPGEIEFYLTCTRTLPSESSPKLHNGVPDSLTEEVAARFSSADEGIVLSPTTPDSVSGGMKRTQSNSSLSDQSSPPQGSPKPALRRKNKPAPIPPGFQESKPKPERPEKPPRIDGAGSLPRNFARTPGSLRSAGSTGNTPPPVRPSPPVVAPKVASIAPMPRPEPIGLEKIMQEVLSEDSEARRPVPAARTSILPADTRRNSADVSKLGETTVQDGDCRPKPAVPSRPVCLRNPHMASKESLHDCDPSEAERLVPQQAPTFTDTHASAALTTSTIETNTSDTGTASGHRRHQSLGKMPIDRSNFDLPERPPKPELPDKLKGELLSSLAKSEQTTDGETVEKESKVPQQPASPVPAPRPPRPQVPPPIPATKPRSKSSESTDL